MNKNTKFLLLSIVIIMMGLLGSACSSEQTIIEQAVQQTVEAQTNIENESNESPPVNDSQESTLVIPTTDSNESQPSSELAESIIGLWKWQGNEGWQDLYEFTSAGEFVSLNGEKSSYEVVSENTIIIKNGNEEKAMRILNYQEDELTIEQQGVERTYLRVEAVPNLTESIIGLWTYQNEEDEYRYAIEFTADNMAIVYYEEPSYRYIHGKYRLLSDNTIEIYDAVKVEIDESAPSFFMPVTNITDNNITFYQSNGTLQTMSHIEAHPNLTERIVGLWRSEDGVELEFTSNGRYIIYNDLLNYDVVSNNTIKVHLGNEFEYYNIVDLTDDVIALDEFGWYVHRNIVSIEDENGQVQEVETEHTPLQFMRVTP